LANPMEVAGALLLFGLAWLLASWWLAMAGLSAAVYSAGLAASDDESGLTARFGPDWLTYRAAVRRWWPRWRPYLPAGPARLYVAATCDLCAPLGRGLALRHPVALELLPAEHHPNRAPRRLTYAPAADEPAEDGLAA